MTLEPATEVLSELTALYGTYELIREGVVHVTSARRSADGRLHVISIGAHAPRSSTDYFVLNFCRARADAILTSAGNMRAEPELVHSLDGPHAGALGRYRSNVLDKSVPPVLAILTRTGNLPLEHPVWSDGTFKVVLTTPDAQPRLHAELGARAEVVGLDHLDARRAAQWLRDRGHALVSIEAGPHTIGPLYDAPPIVDELLLSLYEAAPDIHTGDALPEDATLFAHRTLEANTARDEESGPWHFQRWLHQR